MNERKVIAVALVVIATVMVVNLFADTERSAEAQLMAGPVEPVVVAGAVTEDPGGNAFVRFIRFWSDGAVDMKVVDYFGSGSCSIQGQCGPISILPGSCPSDVTRNGAVEFADMLSVLEDWGPCP